jgi:hypothetical protein
LVGCCNGPEDRLPRAALHMITLAALFFILPQGLFDLTNGYLSLHHLSLFIEEFEIDHPRKQRFPKYVM